MIDYLVGGAVLLILACFAYANAKSGRARRPLVGSDLPSATGLDLTDFSPPIDADAGMDHHHHDHGADHGGHHDFDIGGGHHH